MVALTVSRGVLDRFLFWLTAIAFALIVLWDASGLALWMARFAGGARGFALSDDSLLVLSLHEIASRRAR
jgi:hypothetical protein